MHKKAFTLALGGLAIIGVLAGASYISGGSLLSSVLTTTPPVCQEQENDFALATQALEQYPERANIAERVTILTEAAKTAEVEEKKLADTITATVKKRTKYESLALLNRDLMQHKRLTTEVTRLTNIRPQTATIKTQLTAKKKELSAFNALVKKTTKSATTIDVLYKKYIAPLKELALHTAALEKLATAQRALITVQEEQSVITQAESRLTTAKEALETCRAKTPEIQKESVTYCFPIYQGADGVVQTNCVDDVSKIPQCYVKSTTTAIYDDETGELSSVNVVSDDNTKELFFCGDPETAYLDSANPTSGYPTMPGQGSNPGAEAAAPMGAENPNSPRNNPVQPEDNETKKCESGIVVAKTAQCPEEAKCGNDVCEYGEDHNSCPDDCALSDIVETCGNGIIDDGEDCDTGEREGKWNSSCMACSFHCNSEPITNYAGDGPKSNYMIVKMGHPRSLAETQMHEIGFKPGLFNSIELKNNTNACLYTILPCGNGKVDTFPIDSGFASETCDDGNFINDDGCNESCKKEVCGDGIKQRNEECDYHDAVQSGFECTEQCKLLEIRRPG